MSTYYGTFGNAHHDPQTGERLNNSYVKVHAPTYQAAHNLMFRLYGQKWAVLYLTSEDAGVDRFSLRLHAEHTYTCEENCDASACQ